MMDIQVLDQLVCAVNAILDPNTPHNERIAAHRTCESCKENKKSDLIGYALVSKQDADSQVKQFGLQLMQHFVRNRWTKAPQEAQIQTKNNAIEMIKNCHGDESTYVKDGIAHVLAEIIKHVWPQQWPTMVQELLTIADQGAVQTELVELVFLRIAEDVAVLQNISVSHRSQDIRQGLSLSMGELMEFFMTVLQCNSSKYASLYGTVNNVELEELKVYRSLSVTTLKTLQGFLEWASTEHIFDKNGAHVQLLCRLLEVEGLKILAAECLVLTVYRKGQAHDRKRILVLTTPKYIEGMVSSIKNAVNSPVADEDQYLFLKRMGELLSSLAVQVVASWASERESAQAEGTISNLASHTVFLDVLLSFLQQHNPVLADTVAISWNSLLQHCGIVKDETMRRYVPALLQVVATGIQNCCNTELPVYARLDFNDTEEIRQFLAVHRKNLLQIVRGCACALPNECISASLDWLGAQLKSRIDTGVDDHGIKLEYCCYRSPSYIRWDTMKSILDVTIKTGIFHAKRQDAVRSIPTIEGEKLLNEVLHYETSDVLLCQCQLGFIGAFLPMLQVLDHKKYIVIGIIQKYAKMLRYSVTHPEYRSLSVSQFRRHGLSAIVHLCKYFPSLVMLVYDDFKQTMGELVNILSDLEKISIFESLVLVSGEQNNYAQQSALIGEAMAYATKLWIPKDDNRIRSPTDFAKAIGLYSPGSSYFDEQLSVFRANISFCVSLTLAVINRSRVPDSPDAMRNGSFFDSEGNILHPCSKHVLCVMEDIASLVENLHGLWTSPVMSMMYKDYLKCLDIRDSERRTMVSFNPVISKDAVEKAPWQRMQSFIFIVLENCYQILGGVGNCCNVQLYGSPNLFPVLLKKAFSNIHTLPELRIRSFTRQFLFYFLKSCPDRYYHSVVAPVLHDYCKFMNEILQKQWSEYAAREQARLRVIEPFQGEAPNDEDTREEDEILKEQLLRVVSREYLEMLVHLCVNKWPQPKTGAEENERTTNDDTEMKDEAMPIQSTPNTSQLTPLGLSLTQTEIADTLLATALKSMSWHDTNTAFKGVQLSWPLLKYMFSSMPSIPDEAAKFIFESVLLALKHQGQHEGCAAQLTALGLFTFVTLRPTHDSLLEALKAIPRINYNALDVFDKAYAAYPEKKRRASFKKLLSGTIDRYIGERYKCRQEMRRLPRLFRERKAKSLDFNVGNLGLELFFGD